MPALSGITKADPVQYTARMGNESVTVVFDAARMTGRWERDIRQALDLSDVDTVAERLFSVFASWDVVDDAGNPVPMSSEILMDLPGKALRALFSGMQDAVAPSSEEGKALSDISSTPAPTSTSQQASLQNGPTPSTLPQSSASPSIT
jgi:hypothetical protein